MPVTVVVGVTVVSTVIGVVLVATLFYPERANLPPTSSPAELQQLIAAYQANIEQTPFMLTFRLVGAFFGLWFVALQACALRVVSGFSLGGTWVVGSLLGLVFVLLPWAIQRV